MDVVEGFSGPRRGACDVADYGMLEGVDQAGADVRWQAVAVLGQRHAQGQPREVPHAPPANRRSAQPRAADAALGGAERRDGPGPQAVGDDDALVARSDGPRQVREGDREHLRRRVEGVLPFKSIFGATLHIYFWGNFFGACRRRSAEGR